MSLLRRPSALAYIWLGLTNGLFCAAKNAYHIPSTKLLNTLYDEFMPTDTEREALRITNPGWYEHFLFELQDEERAELDAQGMFAQTGRQLSPTPCTGETPPNRQRACN